MPQHDIFSKQKLEYLHNKYKQTHSTLCIWKILYAFLFSRGDEHTKVGPDESQ